MLVELGAACAAYQDEQLRFLDAAAVALYFMHYNLGRPHGSLGNNTTPAIAAGISDHVWTCEEIAALLD